MRILAFHQEFKQNVNFPREVANLSVPWKDKNFHFYHDKRPLSRTQTIVYTRSRREETYLQVLAPQGLFLDCSDLLHPHAFPSSVVLQVPVVLPLLANMQQLVAEFQRVIRAFELRT